MFFDHLSNRYVDITHRLVSLWRVVDAFTGIKWSGHRCCLVTGIVLSFAHDECETGAYGSVRRSSERALRRYA